MSRHILVLLWLICGSTLGYRHIYPHGDHIRLLMGRPEEGELAILKSAGATFEADSLGMWIKPDEAGAIGLFKLRGYHRTRWDLALENRANATTVKTADGTPYRRKFACLENDGKVAVHTDRSDFKWVYDPTNPNAEHEGHHAGYVAMPNVNVLCEEQTCAIESGYVSLYERALGKIEESNPRFVTWRTHDLARP